MLKPTLVGCYLIFVQGKALPIASDEEKKGYNTVTRQFTKPANAFRRLAD
jgi:hypothetical protein